MVLRPLFKGFRWMPLTFSIQDSPLGLWLDHFVPVAAQHDAEIKRRTQLFIAFSFLGGFFGLMFAGFYLFIGHPWGAAIVLACTASMVGAPWIIQAVGLEIAGSVYAGILVLGFTGLTAIEGGIHGHAVAWLAVVPLCACILVDRKTGRRWCVVCVGVMGVFCGLDIAGVQVPRFYPERWESTITSAGYLSLTVFMSLVGISFENGRRRALNKLHDALDALSSANARLSELDKERTEIMQIAAHDLRNPLNSIVGFAHLLQLYGPELNAKQTDALQRIVSASGRMRDLLNQLLSVQAIEEGKVHLRRECFDLTEVAEAAVQNHRVVSAAKGISVGYRTDQEHISAEADKNAVAQVVDNLLSNAIKFSYKDTLVDVRVLAGTGNGHVTVEIQDAGPGLSEEDQRKLYGKFARLSARPTGGEISTGLGLSIAKRMAEQMGGELSCRSELGKGATFSLTLKAAPRE